MSSPTRFLLPLLLLSVLLVAYPALAQSPAPTLLASPSPTPLPPTPTPPPAYMVIQPTPTPAPTPQGSLLSQVWDKNQEAIILAVITTLITGIIIGVFLKRIASTLADWAGRLFHFLFDRFASAPLLRWRYDKAYRRALENRVQMLAASNIVDREMKLDEIYVPVGLTEETQTDTAAAFEDMIQWDEDRRRRQRARTVEPWAAVRRFPRMVVMGEPGAGKTTYLSHLALLCARRERLDTHTPIFARLRDLVEVDQLEDALPQVFAELNFPNADRFIERRLKANRCLILLDGLDEVETPEQHQHLIKLVQEFSNHAVRDEARNGTPGNVVIVSSRTHSYQHSAQLSGFTKTEVMDFDDPTIERFVNKWFDPQHLRPLAPRLLDTLAKNRRFRELARNPLLLLLIVDHYGREHWLPDGRADLYDRCIDTRIARWNERRGTHRGRFGKMDKRRMLRELALHLFQTRHQGLLKEDVLCDWLTTFIAENNIQAVQAGKGISFRPEDFLTEVVEDSGLIRERALGRYGFSHLTLQEYFTAEGAARLGATEGADLLSDHLADPGAQETILLYCGLADDAGPLLEEITLRAQTRDGGMWLLAGRCLAERAPKVTEESKGATAYSLLSLVRRAEAGEKTALTPTESNQALRLLPVVASPAALADYARELLTTGASHDTLLAARLLPEDADSALRTEVSRRLELLTRTGEETERRVAAAALGQVATADEAALSALRERLADTDLATRAESIRALARLGAKDEATLAALLRLYADDPANLVRHAALEALLALGQAEMVGMVLVPAGRFLMGSADGDPDARENEMPQHEVYVPDFHIDRTPVTNAQYRSFVEADGYTQADYWAEAVEAGRWRDGAYIDYYDKKPRTQPRFWEDSKWNGAQQPVVGVSWYEALAYARWAGKQLPSEAEWEKAAGWDPAAGHKRRYPWGDEWREDRANTKEAGHEKTTPVENYPEGASPCGAVDMIGNVWEWCQTAYRDYPYNPDDGREELGGGDDVIRVLRGSSWAADRTRARCACRGRNYPWNRNYFYFGFRC
jgi:formylglycine-generating enzyme required for sulfatase activity